MKKSLLTLSGIVIIFIGFNLYFSQRKVPLSEWALKNVEALAQGEGTNVGTCYLIQSFATRSAYRNFCDTETSSDKIYPCPKTTSYNGYNDMAIDRCTK